MAKRNTSIHINGKRYDALSGALLQFEEAPLAKVPNVKSIDGVIGGHQKPVVMAASVQPAAAISQPAVKRRPAKAKTTTRTAAKHATIKRTTPSSTLMRHAVKKPSGSLKKHAKSQTAMHHAKHLTHTSRVVVIPKTSLNGVNHVRAARAAKHQTHPRVSHFAREINVVAAAVKTDIQETVAAIDKAIVIPQTYSPSGAYRPDIRRVRVSGQQSATSDIFEQALLRATSHEQPVPEMPKSRLRSLRRRMVSFTAGAVAVLSLVGFFGYQKQDALQFRMAARQAGFAASMPGYQPHGYSINAVKTSGGAVLVRYASNVDKTYTISQKPTIWQTETLLERITVDEGANTYSTTQVNGRTVVIYGRNQAAWVHNGVLYQVLGNGVLSSQDFTRIASSM